MLIDVNNSNWPIKLFNCMLCCLLLQEPIDHKVALWKVTNQVLNYANFILKYSFTRNLIWNRKSELTSHILEKLLIPKPLTKRITEIAMWSLQFGHVILQIVIIYHHLSCVECNNNYKHTTELSVNHHQEYQMCSEVNENLG